MATLVVEDGTGTNPGANSYVGEAEVDAYFAARANANWSIPPGSPNWAGGANKGDSILIGCAYLENAFRGRWKGYRVRQDQPLAWPRTTVSPTQLSRSALATRSMSYLLDADGFPIAANTIPRAVKAACCELARMAGAKVDLALTDGIVRLKSRRAGDHEEVYASPVSERDQGFLVVERLLEPFLTAVPGASFGNVPLMRG